MRTRKAHELIFKMTIYKKMSHCQAHSSNYQKKHKLGNLQNIDVPLLVI